jgi:uncharacterized protein (TIGR02300 family)
MAQTASLGKKHICAECSTKFYDLGKDPAACPKCGTEVVQEVRESVFAMVTPKAKQEKKPKKSAETKELDAMKMSEPLDMMDDGDDELGSLSELDDRPTQGQHAGHDDDVEESDLMDEKAGYGTILDNADHLGDEEARA